MLSDAEERKLLEIEAQLRAEDPTFVGRFPASMSAGHSTATVIAVVVALLTCGIGLAFSSIGAVVLSVAVVAATMGMWVRRGSHRRR